MRAVRLHGYHQQPVIDEVPEPTVKGPLDVVVKIGGAGVCRTDLHIIEGQWAEAMNVALPYTIGHENAGWVHEVGSAVTNVAVGDTVILHPTPTCGLCRACRAGQDMHCVNSSFPGLGTDGGMAEYLLTSARACVKLDPETEPKDVAALADAARSAAAPPASGEAWQDLIFTVAAEAGLPNGRAFAALYAAFLGRPNGPRAGWLLASLDSSFVIQRLRQAGAANGAPAGVGGGG